MIRDIFTIFILLAAGATMARAQPNIVVIWGEELDYQYMVADNEDIRGCWTPNIDRIARGGAIFTDAYGERGSTAAQAAFIAGQSPFRAGLTRTTTPGADFGMRSEDPTLVEYLKTRGYMTAKFGKHPLGDRDAHLPTNHGFDAFFGSLYDLNSDGHALFTERPNAEMLTERRRPRGVIRSFADGRIEDTGPLSRDRIQTLDQEATEASLEFIEHAVAMGKPFFVWWSSSRPDIGSDDATGHEKMMQRLFEHDSHVGQLLDKIDELDITDDTIVVYSSDNGARLSLSPDAATNTDEDNAAPESHFRVPLVVRWPGVIQPGTQINEIVSHLDWFPTFAAALGDGDFTETLKRGIRLGKKRFKVHLDGYNLLHYLQDADLEWPREEYFYFSDSGDLLSVRYDDWKIVFSEQRAPHAESWNDPFVLMHKPKLISLRQVPAEHEIDESSGYQGWHIDRLHVLTPAQDIVGEFLISFEQFPPRNPAPAGFSFARLLKKLQPGTH